MVNAEPSGGYGRPTTVAVAFVIALGLFLRIWILGRMPITSDQAVVGLMAREILHGHFFAYTASAGNEYEAACILAEMCGLEPIQEDDPAEPP